MTQKLKLLDLFSGIGGFSLGLERTGGFETVAFCEIEDFPRRILAKHWPKVPCYEDVRTLTAERLATDGVAVDAICGGFPCQDISASGAQKGIHGERSKLWFEFARLIGEIRPVVVFVENSPELLSRGFGDLLGSLASIGYDAEWSCISASDAGAPHKRNRLWITAYPTGQRFSQSRGLVEPITSAPQAYREASQFKRAFQRGDLPYVCRGHDGISAYVDQDAVRALGNAVVPQIPELLGNAYLASIAEPTK